MMRMAEPRLLSCTNMESLYEELKGLGDGIISHDPEAAHRLVLRSLDVLMRTSLAQFVEIERMKHRLALQQQELDRTRSRQLEKQRNNRGHHLSSMPTLQSHPRGATEGLSEIGQFEGAQPQAPPSNKTMDFLCASARIAVGRNGFFVS